MLLLARRVYPEMHIMIAIHLRVGSGWLGGDRIGRARHQPSQAKQPGKQATYLDNSGWSGCPSKRAVSSLTVAKKHTPPPFHQSIFLFHPKETLDYATPVRPACSCTGEGGERPRTCKQEKKTRRDFRSLCYVTDHQRRWHKSYLSKKGQEKMDVSEFEVSGPGMDSGFPNRT